MRIIDRFSSEHDVFLEQLAVVTSLAESDASIESIVAAIRTLAAPLLAHAEAEEQALFPELAASLGGEGGPIAILTEEHATIHGQIDELLAYPKSAQLEIVLAAFDQLLRVHIDKEEQVLFPAAAQILGDERLVRLDDERRRAAMTT